MYDSKEALQRKGIPDDLVTAIRYIYTSAQIEALNLLKENDKITAESVDRILGANPTNLYGF